MVSPPLPTTPPAVLSPKPPASPTPDVSVEASIDATFEAGVETEVEFDDFVEPPPAPISPMQAPEPGMSCPLLSLFLMTLGILFCHVVFV